MTFEKPTATLQWMVSPLLLAGILGLAACSSSDKKSSTPVKVSSSPIKGSSTTSSSASSSASSSSSSGAIAPTKPTTGLVDAEGKPVNVEFEIVNAHLQPQKATAINVKFTSKDGEPVNTVGSWQVSSPCLTEGLSTLSNAVTGSTQISYNYTTIGCVGEDVLTLSNIESPQISYTANITIEDQVSYISWVSTEPNSIAITGSGGTEKAVITFKLNGLYGSAVAGQTVNFRLEGIAGDTVRLVETVGVSNNEGLVNAVVLSGSIPNVVTVVARHEESDTESPSGGLIVATGLPSANHFSIALEKFSLDAWNRLNSPDTAVTVSATDRAGNPVVDGTVVNFVSPYSGAITPSCTTVNSTCSVRWKPDGREPANGRVQILATVKGTEDFLDINGNHIFDDGDIFNASYDLAEPYISREDADFYQIGDYFVDTNRNHQRDGGDGMWNGLGCQHSSLCSSDKRYVDLAAKTTLIISRGDTPEICSFGDFASLPLEFEAGSLSHITGLYLSDGNRAALNPDHICPTGNPLPSGTEISFSVTEGGSLEGITSWVVPDNATQPTGPYAIRFKAGTEATTGTLTLRIAAPGGTITEFYIDIAVKN